MTFLHNLRIFRRRWYVVVIAILVGFAAGYVSAPGRGARPVFYAATTTLIVNPRIDARAEGVNLGQAALLGTTGQIPLDVASRLGIPGGGEAAREGVEAVVSKENASLAITAASRIPTDAEARSAAFADGLAGALASQVQSQHAEQLREAQTWVDLQQNRVNEANAALPSVPARQTEASTAAFEAAFSAGRAKVTAANAQLALAQQTFQELQLAGTPPDPLVILERGVAERVAPPTVRAPDDKAQRGALLAAFGLILGLGAALALDRLDTRIRTKETAEHAYGFPVISEIPRLPSRKANRTSLMTEVAPSSPFVEAYRTLRTVVSFTLTEREASERAGQDALATNRVIVVTSASASEGKTTTAAHLAVSLAEVGRSVLLVSADVRRPLIHQYFGLERGPGLTDLLDTDIANVAELIVPSRVPGLRFLPSGEPLTTPAALMNDVVRVIERTRPIFDYVIVDTAPFLVANDASELIQAADAVLITARARRTGIDVAERAAQGLQRIGAPVLGVVLVGVASTGGYAYYRNRYYVSDPAPGRFKRNGATSSPGKADAKAGQDSAPDDSPVMVPTSSDS